MTLNQLSSINDVNKTLSLKVKNIIKIMNFFKSLEQSLIKFNDIDSIIKQLTMLITR